MLLVALAASASACGGAPGSSAVGPHETGAGDGGPYTGAIWAMVGVGAAPPSMPDYSVQGGFSEAAENIEFEYPATTAEAGCSCTHGIGSPGPEEVSAGTITLGPPDGGPVLAALVPSSDQSAYFVYGETSAYGWAPGAVLAVSAQGHPGQVNAFSTTLQTAAPFSAVMPAFDAGSMTIARSADFTVSWTPEARAHEIVGLQIFQLTSTQAVQCTCYGPESMGSITMPASSLAEFAPSSPADSGTVSTSFSLMRLVVSTVLTETATVYLIGQASLSGSAELQ